MSVNIIVHTKRIIVEILEHVFVRIKSIVDTSVTTCDEIISVMDIAPTKMKNTIARNVSINSYDKKVRCKIDCYILHTVLLVIKLLLIITIICHYYAKYRSKQKNIDPLTIKNRS